MSIRNKIKILIIQSGHTQKECASFLEYQPEYFNDKMRRNNYSLEDLINIGDFTGNRLVFVNEDNVITAELSSKDLYEDAAAKPHSKSI